ncbi:hypothetical protein DL769_005977 [Monosporascus sp. CRB-8-3]|nr:hypothetical protein DL769_005977 [Monosporascus sp. CRB-8-3]
MIFAASKFLDQEVCSEDDVYPPPWNSERIGNGKAAKAWSLVGSLTRTVEYMQLSVEHEDHGRNLLCQPYSILKPTEDWTELEERRRVFWNVFKLDRFCSVFMGWNTSLTSDDVHRRLPCDGITWRKQEPVVMPYLGIWDKSAGRIGRPITFMLSQHESVPQTDSGTDVQSISDSGSPSTGPTDMSTVGGFAYCIEATESMSRVTSYFLQQKVNLRNSKDINSWLTRFKELDLRLVHWKMLLPEKWKANMERQSTRMDPNLTLAHVTHNVSMILLHQLIAYPPAHWGFRNRLPSVCSADTCFTAATEIATITHNYLKYTPETEPCNSQYAFCVFIAARVLMIHWRYYVENQLPAEFWSLVDYLDEMSRRWSGRNRQDPSRHLSLAAKFALKLRQLHELCISDQGFRIDVAAYMREIDHSQVWQPDLRSPSSLRPLRNGGVSSNSFWDSALSGIPDQADIPVSTITAGQSPTKPPGAPNLAYTGQEGNIRRGSIATITGMDDFNSISQAMLDQQFMNLDRVIAFEDGSMFAAEMDGGSW